MQALPFESRSILLFAGQIARAAILKRELAFRGECTAEFATDAAKRLGELWVCMNDPNLTGASQFGDAFQELKESMQNTFSDIATKHLLPVLVKNRLSEDFNN